MKLLVSVVLLCTSLWQPLVDSPKTTEASVKIVVISQQKIEPSKTHAFSADRIVTFRLTNESDKSLTIFGRDSDDGFDLAGEILKYDVARTDWVYPSSDGSRTSFNDFIGGIEEPHVLKPREAMTFERGLNQAWAGKKLRLATYVKFADTPQPVEIFSEEFVLD